LIPVANASVGNAYVTTPCEGDPVTGAWKNRKLKTETDTDFPLVATSRFGKNFPLSHHKLPAAWLFVHLTQTMDIWTQEHTLHYVIIAWVFPFLPSVSVSVSVFSFQFPAFHAPPCDQGKSPLRQCDFLLEYGEIW